MAMEFIKSNKLRYASPVKRLSKINLLCKQKSSRIKCFNNFTKITRFVYTRADQNEGSARLESPMRTAMHGKSRVLSVISGELN